MSELDKQNDDTDTDESDDEKHSKTVTTKHAKQIIKEDNTTTFVYKSWSDLKKDRKAINNNQILSIKLKPKLYSNGFEDDEVKTSKRKSEKHSFYTIRNLDIIIPEITKKSVYNTEVYAMFPVLLSLTITVYVNPSINPDEAGNLKIAEALIKIYKNWTQHCSHLRTLHVQVINEHNNQRVNSLYTKWFKKGIETLNDFFQNKNNFQQFAELIVTGFYSFDCVDSQPDWERPKQNAIIGKGAYGRTFKVCKKIDGDCNYIVKVPKDNDQIAEVEQEVKMIQLVNQLDRSAGVDKKTQITPNLLNHWTCGGRMFVVLEKMYPLPSENEKIGGIFSQQDYNLLRQKLDRLHEARIVHFDIAPRNLVTLKPMPVMNIPTNLTKELTTEYFENLSKTQNSTTYDPMFIDFGLAYQFPDKDFVYKDSPWKIKFNLQQGIYFDNIFFDNYFNPDANKRKNASLKMRKLIQRVFG